MEHGSPNQSGGNWLTGDPTRDPVRQFVMDAFAKHGKQPTGPGSGPTDLEYYVDRILQEGGLNSGYDWAGRISRGITARNRQKVAAARCPPASDKQVRITRLTIRRRSRLSIS
jgi:hypothetical protein